MSRWGAATANTEAPKAPAQVGAALATLFLSPQHNPTFSSPVLAEECPLHPLHILDPHVRENDHGYKLTFNLPDAVTEDGLDISVRFVLSVGRGYGLPSARPRRVLSDMCLQRAARYPTASATIVVVSRKKKREFFSCFVLEVLLFLFAVVSCALRVDGSQIEFCSTAGDSPLFLL